MIKTLAVTKKEKFANIERISFNNGMTLCVIPYHKTPLVSIVVAFKAGSIFENENLGSGLSHFVEHMAFKGTHKRTSQDFINEISKAGGYINAYTSYERTVYYATVNSRWWVKAYEAISDAILNSTFDEKEFIKEKEVVIKEMERAEENPQEILWNLFTATTYKNHPYRIPVGGFIDKIKLLTREKLVEYFNSYYTPQKMCICIVGDVNCEEVTQQTLEFFNGFFREEHPLPELQGESNSSERRVSFRNLPAIKDNVKFMLGYRTVNVYSSDIPKIDVLCAILGSGRSSKLVNRLVYKEKIASEINVAHFSGFYPGFLYISGLSGNVDNLRKIYKIIWEEYNLLKSGITEEELEKVKNNVIMDFYRKRETVQDRAMLGAIAQFYMNDPLYDEKYVDMIKKVKLDDILQIVPEYIKPENEVLTFVAPEEQKVQEFVIPSYNLNFMNPSATANDYNKSGVETGEVDGIKWIFEKDSKVPLVSFTIMGCGGLRVANKGAIAHLASKMIMAGTPTKSADSIAGVIERLGAYVDSSSHNDTYSIEATTLKEHFTTIFSLVWECLNNPTFPLSEFKNLKNITKYQVLELYEDPFNRAYRNLRKNLFRNHPYRYSVLGEPSEINNASLEEIKDIYKKIIRRNNVVVSVVGDISKNEFIDVLTRNLSKYKIREGKVTMATYDAHFKKGKIIRTYQKGALLPVIFFGFRVCNMYDEDRFPVAFIDSYLGGMSGVLFKKIREEKGLCYEISSFSSFGPDAGALYIYARIDKEEEENVRRDIEQILNKIKKEGISDEELLQFKNEITGSIIRQTQRNIARANNYGLYTVYNLGLDFTQKFIEKIEKLTNDQIKEVANKYLDLDKAVVSIVYPKIAKNV